MKNLKKNWRLLPIMICTSILVEFIFDDFKPAASDLLRTGFGSVLIYFVVAMVAPPAKDNKVVQHERG